MNEYLESRCELLSNLTDNFAMMALVAVTAFFQPDALIECEGFAYLDNGH
ncbi:MAG: hypothetical protein BroJett015_40640 [Chloroflexota bacterium]|nr:MAG: hypothetical protein BroJett015_40640 [Chloroflexota bacterium]